MFGPNPSTHLNLQIDYHHRESKFSDVYSEVLSLFRSLFAVPDHYEIAIYSGSGTLAVEAFIASFKGSMRVDGLDGTLDKFGVRWQALLSHYGKYDPLSEYSLKVLFETSESRFNGDCNATFVDAVSGFPFWPTPQSPAWCTVSSKLLGASPVLSILVVDRGFLASHLTDTPSYLSPFKYLDYQRMGQTPFTPAIPLFQDFRDKLREFDIAKLRSRIAEHYEILVDVIGVYNLVNPELSPVLTVQPEVIPEEVVDRWCLYGAKSGGYIQIFLYSETTERYEMLARDIKRARGKVCQKDRATEAVEVETSLP